MSENPKLQSANIGTNQPRPPMPIGPGAAGRAGMGLVEKPKNFSATMKKLVSYMRPFWISIIFVFIFAIASTVFAIFSPKILGNMTNQIVSDLIKLMKIVYQGISCPALLQQCRRSISAKSQNFLAVIELLMLLYILSAIFSYIQGWIMTGVSQKITYRFRRDISEKINRLPLAYFDKRTFGEVLSRVTNDVDTVSQTLNQSLTQIVTSITMIIGILIMMFIDLLADDAGFADTCSA